MRFIQLILLQITLGLSGQLLAKDFKTVEIVTNQGNMKLKLFEKKFPITVANFLKYTEAGYFKETLFYRVVADFVIQGGNVNLKYEEKEDLFAPIKNEACNDPNTRNTRGTIAMARYSDLDSATSAFYINLKHNAHLDCDAYKYTVFGEITSGLDVLEKIGAMPVRTLRDFTHLPVEDVVIKEIKILE